MAGATRYDRNEPRPGDLRHSLDGKFELAFDHLVDFFLRVEVFVNGEPRVKS